MDHYNAIIDESKCVNCGICHQTCPISNVPEKIEPIQWIQGWSKDLQTREESASGGYATAISKKFVSDGGIVCSCIFNEGRFVFDFADSVEKISRFTGSKYVKSDAYGIYKKILECLKGNNRVLFIGLPCQVAALKNYIPANVQENLYLIDLICHGAPSYTTFNYFMNGRKIEWKDSKKAFFRINNKYQIGFDGESICTTGVSDCYSLAFIKNLIQPEACYECQYSGTKRVSDLTLGDSWGNKIDGQEKKGVSLAMAQNSKGLELLDCDEIYFQDVDIENAIRCNAQLNGPAIKSQKRDKVLDALKVGKDFDITVFKALPRDVVKQKVKAFLIKLHIV